METKVKWLDGMAFEAELNGHRIIIDAEEKFGGKDRGPRPKGLTLVSLIGCTGMDVVSLLYKMKVPFDDFEVSAHTDLTDVHPKVFKDIEIIYRFYGKNLEQYKDKIEKAVRLSQERYCGVSAMLRKNSNLSYKIILKES